MNDAKYIGLDVHQATISAAVLDSDGKLMMESILETKAATILQFVHGLRGSWYITFEEGAYAGTWAAWLHALLQPYVTRLVVCDPRKNALLKSGNKNDRIDARKLADLLRSGLLSPVYHGENGIRTLKELARSYLAVTRDFVRVMGRLKALYSRLAGKAPREVGVSRRTPFVADKSATYKHSSRPQRRSMLRAACRVKGRDPMRVLFMEGTRTRLWIERVRTGEAGSVA